MSDRFGERLGGLQVPKVSLPIARCGHEPAAIRTERGGRDLLRMAQSLRAQFARVGVPDTSGVIHATGNQETTIQTESNAVDPIRMNQRRSQRRAGRGLPETRRSIA